MAAKRKGSGSGSGSQEGERGDESRESLVERYRTILVDRLTRADLAELRFYLRNQFDRRGNLDREYKEKFEGKLRRYLHEEVLTREITGIEALIRVLRPEDLKENNR